MSPHSVDDDDETQTSQNRRRFLLGIGAATAALAGCSGSDDSDDDPDDSTTESFDAASTLPYGEWLTTAADGMLFAYANLDAAPTSGGSDASAEELPDDPLIAYPFVMSQTVTGLGQIRLSFAGLTRAISHGTPSDSSVSEITVVNQTVVAEGTFATDELDEALTDSADATYGIVYERTDTTHGYDRYEPASVPDAVTEPPVVAVAEETVVVSTDADRLERVAAAGDGDQSRFYETNETVARLLEQAGAGDLVVGEVGSLSDETFDPSETFETDPQFEPRSEEAVVASLSFAGDGATIESQFALTADDLGENRRETVTTTFGTAAVDDSASIDTTEDRLTASGTYDAESLGLRSSDGSGGDELSQAAAAELLSPETLAFRYEPPRDQQFGELSVAVTDATDAAAIRLETDSGNSTEIRPQEGSVSAGSSVIVPVESAGDSVTVFVVADDGAVGELTTQSIPADELSESAASEAVPDDALSFSYQPPNAGNFGSLTVDVVADTDAETLVAQPQEAPGLFTDRAGSLTNDEPLGAGTTLETAVDPDGDEVIVYATVGDAIGEVARWQGPN